MILKFPKQFIADFTPIRHSDKAFSKAIASKASNNALSYFAIRQHRKSVLFLKLSSLWRQQQRDNTGHRKWAKADKYVNRFFAKQIFYPCPNPCFATYHSLNQQFSKDFTRLWRIAIPISKLGFEQFLLSAQGFINQYYNDNKKTYLSAHRHLTQFITYQNTQIIEEYHYRVPSPPIDVEPKENPLSYTDSYVTNGKKLRKIIKAVHHHWQTHDDFSIEESLSWLIFSGIIYGGINDATLLQAWLTSLLKACQNIDDFLVFDDYRLLLSIRYLSKHYGNEFENEMLFNTQQIMLDAMSLCWLYRYKQSGRTHSKAINVNALLLTGLTPITNQLGLKKITLSWLLKNACYHWEMLDGVDIDQALVGVMQGRHRTTGLIKADFENLLSANPASKKLDANYDLMTLAKLDIQSTKPLDATKAGYKEKVRRSDLVKDIHNIFDKVMDKKYRPRFIETLNKKPTKDEYILYRLQSLHHVGISLSERILIAWIADFVKRQSANYQSILQYLSTIGYEWIYFTNFQPIDSWTDEDFTETYDEMLDYKKSILGNQDITYAARRLQSLHNFAETNFGLTKVTIEQAESKLKVRAQLLSVHQYLAFLEQLTLNTQGLDGMMVRVFYILAFRTGMRKKELLGLKFSDIELLSSPHPSLLIRPNEHRSIKTEGSIRRVPIFAVLTQEELNFVSDFFKLSKPDKLNQLIFVFADSMQGIGDSLPNNLLEQVLADIGATQEITLHGLRHCTATNLALSLNATPTLARLFTQQTDEQRQRLHSELLGVHDAQEKWHAIASFVGHISPQRTFQYYIHTAMLMATDKITQADIIIPLATFKNIIGFDRRKLGKNGYQFEGDSVNLKTLQPLLNRLILDKRKAIKDSWQRVEEQQLLPMLGSMFDDKDDIANQDFLTFAFHQYSVNQVLTLLAKADVIYKQDLDANFSQIIQQSSIDDDIAQHLIVRAKIIANLKTRKKQPRFTIEPNQLSPIAVFHDDEKKLRQALMLNLRQLVTQKDLGYQKLLTMGIQKLSTRQPALPLSYAELVEFLPIALSLLPAEKWLIKYQKSDSMIYSKLTTLLQSYHEQNEEPKFHLVPSKTSFDYEIGIAHKQSVGNNSTWQFSSLLRFIVHYVFLFGTDTTMIK